MIKRLVPVAAAVVLGLSPNFASAASGHYNKGGKVYSSNQANNSNVLSTNATNQLDFAVNNVDFAHGKGVSLAGGRIKLGFEGALQFDYASANALPLYIPARAASNAESGNRFTSDVVMPLSFRINRNLEAKTTIAASNSMRTQFFDDVGSVTATGHNAAGGATFQTGFGLGLLNAYMVYKTGAFAVFGGYMTKGLSSIDLSPSGTMVPQFHDYMEYTGTDFGVAYTNSGAYVSAAYVDPGLGSATSSRAAKDGTDRRRVENYDLRVGYHGMSGATKYNLNLTYLKDANDLTYINAIRDLTTSSPSSQSSALGFNAGVCFSNFDVNLFFTKLKKNAGITTANTDMDTNNAKLYDLDVAYKVNNDARVSVFYNNNKKGYATGLPRRQYGVEGMYRVAKNTDVGAGLWRQKKNSSAGGRTVTMRNATRFAVNVSYFLG